ncbi:MAG: UPF0179 family protein [Methanomicrobium sp.]|nr:UPF0179 family protein [Methanomicrobium sp.]
MTDDNIRITLIGRALSKIGTEFVYKGDLSGCEGCRMFKVCNNLIPKRRYRIVGIKNENVHSCNIHFEGVCAVEVTEAPVTTLIDVKKAILNSEIIFKPSCTETGCKNYDICFAEGLIEGDRYLVSSISEDMKPECMKGKTLKKVELNNISG